MAGRTYTVRTRGRGWLFHNSVWYSSLGGTAHLWHEHAKGRVWQQLRPRSVLIS